MPTNRMWHMTVVVFLVAFSISIFGSDVQRCTCVSGPPDYLCPSAPLLQVYIQHELYCTRYYKCMNGRAIEYKCPNGLYFESVNNTCTCDFASCYRSDPCIQYVECCRCCRQQFVNTGLAPENFYVCFNDGYALATTCPVAFNPCTGAFIQLVFINGKCEVPPATTTTVAVTTTTTTAATTSTTVDTTTTTTVDTTTTTTADTTTTTTTVDPTL